MPNFRSFVCAVSVRHSVQKSYFSIKFYIKTIINIVELYIYRRRLHNIIHPLPLFHCTTIHNEHTYCWSAYVKYTDYRNSNLSAPSEDIVFIQISQLWKPIAMYWFTITNLILQKVLCEVSNLFLISENFRYKMNLFYPKVITYY